MKTANKSKLLLIAFGLIAYTSANAATDKPSEIRLHVLECYSEKVMPDNNLEVTIDQLKKRFEATVTKSTIVGPRKVGKFTVKREQSDALGAPTLYIGKNFKLEIYMVAPVNGGWRAHLLVDRPRGQRISENMLCLYTRSL
ncbi:MAG: hypothetical protein AABZ06_00575 [Bdellovibrionota bacterium]